MATTALLATCSGRREVHVWDTCSGLLVRAYKDCAAPGHGLCVLDADHFVAAQLGRPSVHIYAWAREQPIFRCQVPEELRALASTSDGAHCIGGSVTGRLYIWAVRTGQLLRAWDAHFKACTALAVSADDGALIVGGADALVTVWSLADVLGGCGPGSSPAEPPSPTFTWSAHSLEVSDVAVGGSAPSALAVSGSLDGGVHVRELGRGELLYALRAPAPVRCVALSACEHRVFCGTSNGTVHEALLVAGPGAEGGDGDGGGGGLARADGGAESAAWPGGRGAGGAADGPPPLVAHKGAVHALCTLDASTRLATVGADGGVRVFDAGTRQLVQQLDAPGEAAPSESVRALAWSAPPRAPPVSAVQPFKKYLQVPPPKGSAEAAQVALGCVPVRPAVRAAAACDWGAAHALATGGMATARGGAATQSAVRAEEEAAVLRERVEQWRALSAELYALAAGRTVDELVAAPDGTHAR